MQLKSGDLKHSNIRHNARQIAIFSSIARNSFAAWTTQTVAESLSIDFWWQFFDF